MNINEINFSSYSKVESLSNFENDQEISAYRQRRLKRYESHVNFISEYSKDFKTIKMLEVGSGSSGLLYALSKKHSDFHSYGVELSTSRYEFAEKWKQDENLTGVKNINANFCDISEKVKDLNWYAVIDNTFSYLAPEDKKYPLMLLNQAHEKLQSGGYLLIDIINYSERIRKGSETFWTQFPDSDPFKYGLYSFDVLEKELIVTKSVFISRKFTEDVKTDVSYFYSKDSLEKLVSSSGFKIEGVYGTFNKDPFISETSDRLILIAKKI